MFSSTTCLCHWFAAFSNSTFSLETRSRRRGAATSRPCTTTTSGTPSPSSSRSRPFNFLLMTTKISSNLVIFLVKISCNFKFFWWNFKVNFSYFLVCPFGYLYFFSFNVKASFANIPFIIRCQYLNSWSLKVTSLLP